VTGAGTGDRGKEKYTCRLSHPNVEAKALGSRPHIAQARLARLLRISNCKPEVAIQVISNSGKFL